MTPMRLLTAIGLCLACVAPANVAAEPIRNVRVHFPAGTSGTSMHGHLGGRELIDYRIRLSSGQMFRAHLSTTSDFAYFNIYEPGKKPGEDAAFYVGSTGGNTVEFRTSHSGDYLVRVYLIAAAARRNQSANFVLEVAAGSQPPPVATARRATAEPRVSAEGFSATGTIPCARERGQPIASCRFGVRREGNGNGTITVFWPDGAARVIRFEDNTPMSFEPSQADGEARMTVGSEADLFHVRIGAQRFEIPAAVMTGG